MNADPRLLPFPPRPPLAPPNVSPRRSYYPLLFWTIAGYSALNLLGYVVTGLTPFGGFLDELLVVISFGFLLLYIGKEGKIPNYTLRLLIMSGVIFLWGAVSLFLDPFFGNAPKLALIFTSGLIDLKFYLLTAAILPLVASDPRRIIRSYCILLVVMALANFALSLIDVVRGVDMHGRALTSRAGLAVPQGFFDHKYKAAFLAVAGWVAGLSLFANSRRTIFFALLMTVLTFSVLLVLSAKEIIAVAIITVFHLTMRKVSGARIVLGTVAILSIAALLLTENPVSSAITNRIDVFSREQTVRGVLYEQAPEVAKDFAPFGAGWGTYGSSASRDVYYSPLYPKYGIAYVWGGSASEGDFLVDLFWAKILGEQGFVGLFIYLYIWGLGAAGAWQILRRGIDTPESRFALYGSMALLIMSFATPIYNYADAAIMAAVCFAGLILAKRNLLPKPRSRRGPPRLVPIQGHPAHMAAAAGGPEFRAARP